MGKATKFRILEDIEMKVQIWWMLRGEILNNEESWGKNAQETYLTVKGGELKINKL